MMQQTDFYSDMTNCLDTLAKEIQAWHMVQRKGKMIIHVDGNGPVRVELDYSIDF